MRSRSVRIALTIAVLLLAARAAIALQLRREQRAAAARIAWAAASEARELGRREGRPVLQLFSASWCAPCKRLRREVFGRERDAEWIGARFVAVRVEDGWEGDGLDDEAGAKLRERLGVHAFPTLLVLRGGRETGRLSGYPGREAVLEFLRTHSGGVDGSPRGPVREPYASGRRGPPAPRE